MLEYSATPCDVTWVQKTSFRSTAVAWTVPHPSRKAPSSTPGGVPISNGIALTPPPATLLQINSFGQTPQRLFAAPHPPRMAAVDPRVYSAIYSAPQRLGNPVQVRAAAAPPPADSGAAAAAAAAGGVGGIGDMLCYGADGVPKLAAVGRHRVFLPHSHTDIRRSLPKAPAGHVIAWGYPDRSLRIYAAGDVDSPEARPVRIWCGTQHRLSFNAMARITSDCDGMRSVSIKWSESPRDCVPLQGRRSVHLRGCSCDGGGGVAGRCVVPDSNSGQQLLLPHPN